MCLIDQHTRRAGRESFLDADGCGKAKRYIARPAVVIEGEFHPTPAHVASISDNAVARHRASPQLHCGVPLALGQLSDNRGIFDGYTIGTSLVFPLPISIKEDGQFTDTGKKLL